MVIHVTPQAEHQTPKTAAEGNIKTCNVYSYTTFIQVNGLICDFITVMQNLAIFNSTVEPAMTGRP